MLSVAYSTYLFLTSKLPIISHRNNDFFFIAVAGTVLLIAAFGVIFMFLQSTIALIHKQLPHPESRVINLFLKTKESKIKYNELEDVEIDLNEIITLGKKAFFKKHFEKDSTNFINFMEERMKYDNKFINYALSIPKKKELSIDVIRKILLSYPDSLKLDRPLNLDKAFENYSLNDIEKIFTQVGSKNILKELNVDTALPLAVHFSELALRPVPDYLNLFDSKNIDGFNFSILKNKVMYDQISDEFNNCVRGRYSNPNMLIIAERNGLKTCIEINTQKAITQMAGPRDSISSDRKELSEIFKNKGFKIKFTLPHIF